MLGVSSRVIIIATIVASLAACTKPSASNQRNEGWGLTQSSSELGDGQGAATVYFPPGLEGLGGSLAIREGSSLANPMVASALNMGSDMASAGPSVSVRGTVEMNANDFGRLQIEIPFVAGASLIGSQFLVVVYAVVGDDGKIKAGVIPPGIPSGYTVVGDKLRFPMRGYGNYQAVMVQEEVKEEKVAVAETLVIQTKEEQKTAPAMEITRIERPLVPKPGQEFRIIGNNLHDGLRMYLTTGEGSEFRSIPFLKISIANAQSATATMPSGLKPGMGRIYLNQDGSEYRAELLYNGGQGEHPVSTVDAGMVCKGQNFYNEQGILLEGTATCGAASVALCTTDGQVGCQTTESFKAADMAQVSSGNIKSGARIAGITGQYPSATYPLANSTNVADLASFGPETPTGIYEFFDSLGTKYSATVASGGTITPTTSAQAFSAAGTMYNSFSIAGASNLTAGNIKSGVSIFDVAGNVTPAPANCSDNGASGCVTTSTYKSADLSSLSAGNIKYGIAIAGVTGSYPSTASPLIGADSKVADLDSSTFDIKIKAAASFEWFDSSGNRHANVGDTDITAANIANNVTIFGATGNLVTSASCTSDGQTSCMTTSRFKSVDTSGLTTWDIRKGKSAGGITGSIAFYKNMANTTSQTPGFFDRTGVTAGMPVLDIYDTIDDYSDGGVFPTQNPGGWDQATGANWTQEVERLIYKDNITGLVWLRDQGSPNWEGAIVLCDNSSAGSRSDWRLPTQKELMQAYTDGIWSQKVNLGLQATAFGYWSASTHLGSANPSAWVVYPHDGSAHGHLKSSNAGVICVAP